MPTEQLANNASSTLNGGIDSDDTSLAVASATGFPASGNFRIRIDSEILLVTGVSGNTFTVTRGAEGSTAAGHLTSATVEFVLTKGSLDARLADWAFTGAHGTIPSAGQQGQLRFPNNSFYIYRHTGGGHQAWGPIFPLTQPVDGDFAWVNQGGATVDATKGGIFLNAPASASGSLRIRKKAAPTRPYTITACIIPQAYPADIWEVGLCWRESGSGEVVTYGVGQRAVWGGLHMAVNKWDSPTVFNSNYLTPDINAIRFHLVECPQLFIRIHEEAGAGGNRICDFGHDGQNFQHFFSVGRTDHLTADEIGFFANSWNSQDCGVNLLSWKET